MRTSYPTLAVLAGSLLASVSFAQAPPAPDPAAPQAGNADSPAPNESAATATQLTRIAEDMFNNPARNISLFDFNYGEPGSPVLPLVGVQADQITRVDSLRRFGLSLLTGISSEESGPALAIDVAPFWLLARGPISIERYRSPEFGSLARLFARTKLAAAASRGNEASGLPSSLVFSVSARVLDSQDSLVDNTFETCVRDDPGRLRTILQTVHDQATTRSRRAPPGERAAVYLAAREELIDARRAEIASTYQECADRTATAMSRRSALDIGAGFRLTGAPGNFRDLQGSGAIVWGTFATGVFGGERASPDSLGGIIGMQVRGVIHARYTFSEDFYDQAGVRTGQADSGLVVAGLESVPVQGRPETLRWSIQAGWTRQDSPTAANEDRNYWRYLGIVRYRLREGLWLNGTVGRVHGRGVESDTYVSVGFTIAPAAGSAGIDNFYRRTR